MRSCHDPASGTSDCDRQHGRLTRLSHGDAAALRPSAVAAGVNGGSLSSAELYDPASGTWTATGNMVDPRFAHTATLLLSGQVLAAGGANGGSLSSAELYDPASGTWTATGSMSTPRSRHTATLLLSGQVLVAGGARGTGPHMHLSSAKLYDPGTGLWTATDSMGTARSDHTATLLPSGQVLIAGGHNNIDGYLSSAELYGQGNH